MLLIRDEGAKNLISILFSDIIPGTSGETGGFIKTEVKSFACSFCDAVKGNVNSSSGGLTASFRSLANAILGTSFFSAGTGSPSATI